MIALGWIITLGMSGILVWLWLSVIAYESRRAERAAERGQR